MSEIKEGISLQSLQILKENIISNFTPINCAFVKKLSFMLNTVHITVCLLYFNKNQQNQENMHLTKSGSTRRNN